MNPLHKTRTLAHKQRGAVLVMSLLLLAAVAVLSTSAVSTSIMELRMSSNMESNVNTFQTAMAAVDFVLADSSNLPTSGPLNVPVSVAVTGVPFAIETGETINANAARVQDCGLPPRMRNATSMTAYSSFRYEVTADVLKNLSGMGQAGMVQGYLLYGPKC